MSELAKHPVVQASVGTPLGGNTSRRRAVGRIGGMLGTADPEALARLKHALGVGAKVISGGPANVSPRTISEDWALTHCGSAAESIVADFDCCWHFGQPIENFDQWRQLWDDGCLADVEGGFVLARFGKEGRLTLARDAIGERTLFYALLADGVVFASSLAALLATGRVPRTLSLPSVATYLTYAYLPGRDTLIADVYELLPGEVIEFHGREMTRKQLWSVPPEPPEYAEETPLRQVLRQRLEEAVRRRLPPDETPGVFLSGGLDSSLVLALARELYDGPIKTYSVSFGTGHANELQFSSLVADHCRTDHRIVELSPPAVLRYLDESIALLSDPIGDPLTVPNALLFREASQSVGVVLNGEGGDPCFGGPKNLPMLLAELYDSDEDSSARERSYLRAHLKCYDDLPALLLPEVQNALADSPLETRVAAHFNDSRWRGFVTKLQALNVIFKGAHHILPKIDAVSAPFGVVARAPLFDRSVVEWSFAIPPQLKLRGSVEKYLLKQAVADLLPAVIIERPKSGMLVPVESWFRGPLLPAARERLLDGLAPYGLFQRDYLERLLAGRLGGLRPRHGAKIWLLVTLEAWLRTVFSR